MMKKLRFTLLLSITVLLSGCFTDTEGYSNLSFPTAIDMAAKDKKHFCIVLVDSTCDIKQYKDKVSRADISHPVIWNYVNIGLRNNLWYTYLIGSNKTPFTLVFNAEGNLQNIVYGISQYAIKSIKFSIDSIGTNPLQDFGFIENSLLRMSQNCHDILTQIIHISMKYPHLSENNYRQLTTSIHKQRYPYNTFLKIYYDKEITKTSNDNSVLKNWIMEYGRPPYSTIYYGLISKITSILSEEEGSQLILQPTSENYDCLLNDSLHFSIKAINLSADTIHIQSIEPSCYCVKLLDNNWSKHILPKQSVEYHFLFIPDKEESVYREISFLSNANIPIGNVGITIHVKQ